VGRCFLIDLAAIERSSKCKDGASADSGTPQSRKQLIYRRLIFPVERGTTGRRASDGWNSDGIV
jgi:hypothetical protein